MQVIARKPLRPNDVERVEKDRHSQGVNALKDRQEGRIAQLFSPNVRAEIDAAATERGNRPLYLADSALGIVQRKVCHADEAVGVEASGCGYRAVNEPG